MRPASSIQTSHLSLVKAHLVHRTVNARSAGNNNHIQELISILQTTLNLDMQIELFARKIRQYVKIDAVVYQHPESDDKRTIGDITTHRATYDLKLESKNLGSLCFYRIQHFQKKEIALLENLLSALVYPLRNALEYQHAIDLASHDALTGIQNRHAMDNALQREVELAHRKNMPLSMLILDADNFKQFNDTYGHTYGDAVLKTIADTITSTIRSSDLLFRFGGEEFVVLTSQTVSDGAYLLAERIRRNIASIKQINSIKIHTTISLGIATLLENESGQCFLERADSALYKAKNKGRNRAEIAGQIK